MVRVREVVERRQVDAEDADCRNGKGNGRHDPVDPGEARPSEHEQPDGHACALDARKVQSPLGRVVKLSVLFCNLLLVDG